MAGIDLIPSIYRQSAALRRIFRRTAITVAILLGMFALVFSSLKWQLDKEKEKLAVYRAKEKQLAELRKQVDDLAQRKTLLEHQSATLAMLRGEGDLLLAMQAIDASLNKGSWLTSLRYSRQRLPLDAEKLAANSARMVIKASGTNEAWEVKQAIHLSGSAASYGDLAGFIQSLASQPGIADVRFLNSSMGAGSNGQQVDFNASAAIVTGKRVMP